jgi:hypothetical protein
VQAPLGQGFRCGCGMMTASVCALLHCDRYTQQAEVSNIKLVQARLRQDWRGNQLAKVHLPSRLGMLHSLSHRNIALFESMTVSLLRVLRALLQVVMYPHRPTHRLPKLTRV